MAPMRVLLGDDVVVEVETAEDAARVAYAYRQAFKPALPTRSSILLTLPAPGPPGNFDAGLPKTPARVIFSNGHYPAFVTLWNNPLGVTTEQMVKAMALPSAKSMPPTVGAWFKRAAGIHLKMEELLDVERGYSHGQPSTTYRLTAKGREVFGQGRDEAKAAADAPSFLG